MIYIYLDITNFWPYRIWDTPFYLFGKCLSLILTKHGMKYKMIGKSTNDTPYNYDLHQSDILITFHPFILHNDFKCCKVIYINTESLKSRPFIIDEINTKNNVVTVWDYSHKNIKALQCYNKPIFFVPFTYHPLLETFYKDNSDNTNKLERNIDFFLFGANNNRRQKIIDELINLGYHTVIDKFKDIKDLFNTINKTKIIIIIHHYHFDLCIDFYRLSWLLSNKIFLIHEMPSDDQYDDSFNKIIYSKYDTFVNTCIKYINKSQEERDQISNKLYDWWKNTHAFEDKIPLNNILSELV